MPIKVEFESTRLVFVFEGGTSAHDVYAAFHRAFLDPACPPQANLLVDLSRSTSIGSRTPEMIRSLTEYVLQHPHRPGARMAVVLTRVELARLEPVVASLRASDTVHVRLFDSTTTARAWLDEAARAGA